MAAPLPLRTARECAAGSLLRTLLPQVSVFLCRAQRPAGFHVEGQHAQWGGARGEPGLECQTGPPSFRLNFPELGLHWRVWSSLHCPLNALQILQTVRQCWRGSSSGQSGLGKLGSPGWKVAIGQGASLSNHSPCQVPVQSLVLTFLL